MRLKNKHVQEKWHNQAEGPSLWLPVPPPLTTITDACSPSAAHVLRWNTPPRFVNESCIRSIQRRRRVACIYKRRHSDAYKHMFQQFPLDVDKFYPQHCCSGSCLFFFLPSNNRSFPPSCQGCFSCDINPQSKACSVLFAVNIYRLLTKNTLMVWKLLDASLFSYAPLWSFLNNSSQNKAEQAPRTDENRKPQWHPAGCEIQGIRTFKRDYME